MSSHWKSEKICGRCGEFFTAYNPNQKYCKPCMPLARKEKAKAYSKRTKGVYGRAEECCRLHDGPFNCPFPDCTVG